ncbi:MAG: HD domain-containing protein [Spirochaetia bacterium]|jgi:putative two-component system response regulator|nr:HD domain-containing protein [Spirochaetia bacterium]
MNKENIAEELEILEELEELEETGDIETLNNFAETETAEDIEKYHMETVQILNATSFRFEIQKFRKAPVPVFFMDKRLRVIWMNTEADRYFTIEDNSSYVFIQKLFHPYLNEIRLQSLYESIFSPEKGFSWEGRVEVSGHDRATSKANIIILPYFKNVNEKKSKGPDGYFGIINDITEDNNLLLRNTFKTLLEASKLKDDDTGNHIERVSQYSYRIADILYNSKKYEEIDMEFVINIKFLAAMHDVGKIGTPDNILNKEGKLTDDEWQIMKEHTINGAFILSSYPDKMAMEIARSHHEKWDGNGYPYALSGNDIPLSARIVALADVYDALRMKRIYKDPYSHEKTVSMIKEGRGSHFDPDLVDLFINIEKDIEGLYNQLADND